MRKSGLNILHVGSSSLVQSSSNVILIQNDGLNILVDSGNHNCREAVLHALHNLQLSPDDIDIIINTHLHLDHCANNHVFPNAKVLVHKNELDWITRTISCIRRANDMREKEMIIVQDLIFARSGGVTRKVFKEIHEAISDNSFEKCISSDNFEIVEHGIRMNEHIQLIETPGHTPGHISVIYSIDKSANVIIAGDALAYRNLYRKKITRLPFTYNMTQYIESKAALEKMKGLIVPGHGASFVVKKEWKAKMHESLTRRCATPY